MVLDYVDVGLVSEDAVCPSCGSDLIIRLDGDLVIVLCIDCEFTFC